ncbi:MAG: A/G-specific adenine glycosylase, partial [Bacteroidota bacterium]
PGAALHGSARAPRPDPGLRRPLTRAVLRWYGRNGRTLPWRNIRNPYRILLAEVMLQQTRVRRVLEKYPLFLRRFPTLRSLARAPLREAVIAWRGMGYNRRVVHLHRSARIVTGRHGGRIPRSRRELLLLPGIGPCTADAVRNAAFGERAPVLDVNVRRVLSRILGRMPATASLLPPGEAEALAHRLLPRGREYDWNQALMDLGALLCTASAPSCVPCPAARLCLSRTGMRPGGLRPRRREPSRNGVPDRIHRGRIVEELRRLPARATVPLEELGRRILPGFRREDRAWLHGVLRSLERDGLALLARRQGKTGVSLA